MLHSIWLSALGLYHDMIQSILVAPREKTISESQVHYFIKIKHTLPFLFTSFANLLPQMEMNLSMRVSKLPFYGFVAAGDDVANVEWGGYGISWLADFATWFLGFKGKTFMFLALDFRMICLYIWFHTLIQVRNFEWPTSESFVRIVAQLSRTKASVSSFLWLNEFCNKLEVGKFSSCCTIFQGGEKIISHVSNPHFSSLLLFSHKSHDICAELTLSYHKVIK